VGEDRLLQPAQLGPGVEAELVAQRASGLAVGGERVGLAAGARG
jgi:hypothetical protein